MFGTPHVVGYRHHKSKSVSNQPTRNEHHEHQPGLRKQPAPTRNEHHEHQPGLG